MLIESTGVANPSDLKNDLQLPIFDNRFQFKEQFCVVDAAHFLDAYPVYASLEKQIASSSVFIINKTDTAPSAVVAKVKAVIGRLHPDPVFFETTYADIPLEMFFELGEAPSPPAVDDKDKDAEKAVMSEADLDAFLDGLLGSPDLEITPPDLLMSVAYRWSGDDLDQVRHLAENLPGAVVRAKGFVVEDGRIQLFNYVMGDWSIEDPDIPEARVRHKNVIVFIGPPESMEGIESVTGAGDWTHLGTYQPFNRGR